MKKTSLFAMRVHPAFAVAVAVLFTVTVSAERDVLVEHQFDGLSSVNLEGLPFDFVAPELSSAGGSSYWLAATNFKADGSVLAGGNSNAQIRVGSLINDAKGTPNGRFELTATLARPTEHWMSVMFHGDAAPSTVAHHVHGAGSVGALEYDTSGILNTKVLANENQLSSVATGLSNARTLTVTLDYTPASGYDGVTHHGVITWSDSELGLLRQHILPVDAPVGSILLATSGTTPGGYGPGYSYFSFARIDGPVWFPNPEAAVAADLTLVSEPGFNVLDITFTPKWPLNPGPDTESTTVSGTLEAAFTLDPRTGTSQVFLMTGAGSVSNTDMRFQKSQAFGVNYDLSFTNMVGHLNSWEADGLRDADTAAFNRAGHQYFINVGTANGSAGPETFDQDFSVDPFRFNPGAGAAGSVTLTPTTQGSGVQNYNVEMILPLDGTYEDTVDYSISGEGTLKASGTLSVPLVSDYYTWLSAFSGLIEIDPAADPDSDGTPNILEYILDGDPGASGTAILPAADVTASGDFEFVFVRRSGSKTTTTQTFQHSTNLVDWTSVSVSNVSGENVSIAANQPQSGLETVTVTVDSGTASEGRMFGRLQATPAD